MNDILLPILSWKLLNIYFLLLIIIIYATILLVIKKRITRGTIMIYRVIEERNHTYVYAYYSFGEHTITKYNPEKIVEKNGEFSSLDQGKTYSIINDENVGNYWDDKDYNILNYWNGINIILEGYVRVPGDPSTKYVEICVTFPMITNIRTMYIKESQANSILEYYKLCRYNRKKENDSICKLITEENLQIAENLIVGFVDDELFDKRILYVLNNYSSYIINPEWEYHSRKRFNKSNYYKGKEKKKEEENYKKYLSKLSSFMNCFNNFVEMIVDSNSVNKYVAYAIAWEAIHQKSIKLYANQWDELYGIFLDESFEDIKNNNSDFNKVKYEYIKKVLTCSDIDFTESKGSLVYFLASKEPTEIHNIASYFVECEKLIQDIQKDIQNNEIKEKLKTKQSKNPVKYTIDDIDLMSGVEFEEFVSILFQKMGYKTKITQATGDQGIDVLAIKNNTKLGIQAKCYANTVGNSAVQEAVAGKGYYSCDKVMVVTNNYFTSSAISLAESNGVALWDRDFLKIKIKENFK